MDRIHQPPAQPTPQAPAAARMQALRESIARRILATRHMTDVELLGVARVRSVILLTVKHQNGARPYTVYAFRQAAPIECTPGLANPREAGEWIAIDWRDGHHGDLPRLTADATAWAHHHAATRIAHLHRRTNIHYRYDTELRALAIQYAAQAADTHAANPNTHTLHTMHTQAQAALNYGAIRSDIRRAQAATR
ncbi:hypothetical protein DF268_08590 [Streptomyces sp. V2]|uniref:hypothetical protein n=1 Tax=Streptomyces sp. V2 TaxID=1424099 RepID=UPI000D66D736|nr:hypothetical protein [Streptomyces sp. V2]PWG13914.1 hypothetical protein DF268_08590 [Streptomyces sp. V2]